MEQAPPPHLVDQRGGQPLDDPDAVADGRLAAAFGRLQAEEQAGVGPPRLARQLGVEREDVGSQIDGLDMRFGVDILAAGTVVEHRGDAQPLGEVAKGADVGGKAAQQDRAMRLEQLVDRLCVKIEERAATARDKRERAFGGGRFDGNRTGVHGAARHSPAPRPVLGRRR